MDPYHNVSKFNIYFLPYQLEAQGKLSLVLGMKDNFALDRAPSMSTTGATERRHGILYSNLSKPNHYDQKSPNIDDNLATSLTSWTDI